MEVYPLVMTNIALERSTIFVWENRGKSTMSMAIFNSYVKNYQMVNIADDSLPFLGA